MRKMLVTSVLLALAGCSVGAEAGPDRASLTRAQKDSIVASSSLPHARVVGKALDATGKISARNERLDSTVP